MKNSPIKKKIISAPISIGELVDKITILEIKKNKLQNSKLENVLKELSFLRKLMEKHQIEITDNLFTQLKEINLTLWNIEDQIRIKEKNKEFDNIFIELARSVYFKNDKRAEIKKRINQLYNSEITEEKSYDCLLYTSPSPRD